MEGKKLNLNQPFLSVRRHSQTAAGGERRTRHIIPPIPYYISELKSGPVGKKGAVPFHWEQTPGKPREELITSIEGKAQDIDDLHSAAPKLPPGRYLNPNLKDFHQVSSNRFTIEASNVDNFECLEENTVEKKSTSATEEHSNNNNSVDDDDDDDDEEYVDAVDTLSRSNSTFLNCSMSGVSGLEDLDVKPCRDFTRDPNTLNIVMDRFLPAAKAMVSDKPQYVSKKSIVIRGEQSKDVVAKKMVIQKEDKDKPMLRYGPSYANQHSHHHVCEEYGEDEDIEYDDDEDDDHGHGTLIPSVCGLFPRFCLKASPGILNPVPGMSFRTQVAKSHGYKVRNRSSSNFPNPEILDGFNEVCDIKRADRMGTVVIEENETITGFKSRKKVSKTFAQLLSDKDGPEDSDSGFNGAAERVLSFDTMHTVECQSVPNEVLRSRDKENRDRDEHVDSPSKDLKNSHSVDLNSNSTATDDTKISMKKSEIGEKKYAEFVISPPLPKSPSDSWLWRTLPSVSAKNAHRHSNLGTEANTRDLSSKVPVGVTRWEAIVKSSKMQHDSSHYPEETLTPLQKT